MEWAETDTEPVPYPVDDDIIPTTTIGAEEKTFEKYTEEQYKAEIKQINQQLGKHATYIGELRVQRERLNNIVFDMNESQGTYFNPRDFSLDELYKAYKNAMQRSKEDGKSDYFYEYLSEELESYD